MLRLQELICDLVRCVTVPARLVETLAWEVVVEELLQPHRHVVCDVLNENLRIGRRGEDRLSSGTREERRRRVVEKKGAGTYTRLL